VRFSATRLTLVLLLVSRLILGELASAMPDHGASHFDHAASMQVSGGDSCPDHAGMHDDNCCKSACSCPCLHFSALAAPLLVTQAARDEGRSQLPVIGATSGHVGRLLRPPA
jgi:hypothetical protein